MAKFRLKSGKYHGVKNGNKHTYVKGDVVDLDPHQVRHIMDILEPLEPIETEAELEAAPRIQLKAVHRGLGQYDVINVIVEKPINDVPLTKKEAKALVDGKNLAALEMAPRRQLEAVHKGGGKYNVINTVTGKPVNDVLLTKEEARRLTEGGEDGENPDAKDLAGDDGVHTRRRSEPK